MFNVFIKPLDICNGRFIFFGYFGNMDNINEVVKECIYSPMKQDVVYKRSFIQAYPSRFFEVLIKDSINDEEIFLKTFDAENCKFVEED